MWLALLCAIGGGALIYECGQTISSGVLRDTGTVVAALGIAGLFAASVFTLVGVSP